MTTAAAALVDRHLGAWNTQAHPKTIGFESISVLVRIGADSPRQILAL